MNSAEAFGRAREAIAARDLKGIHEAGGSPLYPANREVLEYVYRVMGWTWRDLRDMNDAAAFANDLDRHRFPSDKEELDVPLALVSEYEDWLRFLLGQLYAFDSPWQMRDEFKAAYDAIMLAPIDSRYDNEGLMESISAICDRFLRFPSRGFYLASVMRSINDSPYSPHNVIASLWYVIPHRQDVNLRDFKKWAYLDLRLRADKWMADKWERKA